MKKETYIKMTGFFKNKPVPAEALQVLNKLCTYVVFAIYPVVLFYLMFNKVPQIEAAIIIPLDGFIVLSVFRYLINRPRPYEKFDTLPVIPKHKKGHSFPSRHVYSAFIISFTILSMAHVCSAFLYLGTALIILSILIAIIRVISGVHFISDVIAAAIFAMLTQLIGEFIAK